MYIPFAQKPIHYIPNTGKSSGVIISTIVNTYTRSLFYLTNAVCHNPPALQHRCVALHTAAMVYTTSKSTGSDNIGKIMTLESNVAKNRRLQSAGNASSVYSRKAYTKEKKLTESLIVSSH
jgi:hypothetical protein